jgi:hypothetical protein
MAMFLSFARLKNYRPEVQSCEGMPDQLAVRQMAAVTLNPARLEVDSGAILLWTVHPDAIGLEKNFYGFGVSPEAGC